MPRAYRMFSCCMVTDAQRYRFYEAAVQTPEIDIAVFERVFRNRVGRTPLTLREDFCGTALLSARWVESDGDREAVAVDRDRKVIAHARRTNVCALEDDRDRVRLVCGDACAPSDRTFDVICAMNFSWAIFDDPKLERYLASAARSLEENGMLALEIFGGPEFRREMTREHAHKDFVYVWEQRAFDERRSILDARIHFRIGRRTMRDAFAYRFYVRSIENLRAMLERAGLSRIDLFVEDRRGRYVRRSREPDRAPLWRGMIAAFRSDPSRDRRRGSRHSADRG